MPRNIRFTLMYPGYLLVVEECSLEATASNHGIAFPSTFSVAMTSRYAAVSRTVLSYFYDIVTGSLKEPLNTR